MISNISHDTQSSFNYASSSGSPTKQTTVAETPGDVNDQKVQRITPNVPESDTHFGSPINARQPSPSKKNLLRFNFSENACTTTDSSFLVYLSPLEENFPSENLDFSDEVLRCVIDDSQERLSNPEFFTESKINDYKNTPKKQRSSDEKFVDLCSGDKFATNRVNEDLPNVSSDQVNLSDSTSSNEDKLNEYLPKFTPQIANECFEKSHDVGTYLDADSSHHQHLSFFDNFSLRFKTIHSIRETLSRGRVYFRDKLSSCEQALRDRLSQNHKIKGSGFEEKSSESLEDKSPKTDETSSLEDENSSSIEKEKIIKLCLAHDQKVVPSDDSENYLKLSLPKDLTNCGEEIVNNQENNETNLENDTQSFAEQNLTVNYGNKNDETTSGFINDETQVATDFIENGISSIDEKLTTEPATMTKDAAESEVESTKDSRSNGRGMDYRTWLLGRGQSGQWDSFHSDHTHGSSPSSVESLIRERETDAEQVLTNLGFGGMLKDPSERIPQRFLSYKGTQPRMAPNADIQGLSRKCSCGSNPAIPSIMLFHSLTRRPTIENVPLQPEHNRAVVPRSILHPDNTRALASRGYYEANNPVDRKSSLTVPASIFAEDRRNMFIAKQRLSDDDGGGTIDFVANKSSSSASEKVDDASENENDDLIVESVETVLQNCLTGPPDVLSEDIDIGEVTLTTDRLRRFLDRQSNASEPNDVIQLQRFDSNIAEFNLECNQNSQENWRKDDDNIDSDVKRTKTCTLKDLRQFYSMDEDRPLPLNRRGSLRHCNSMNILSPDTIKERISPANSENEDYLSDSKTPTNLEETYFCVPDKQSGDRLSVPVLKRDQILEKFSKTSVNVSMTDKYDQTTNVDRETKVQLENLNTSVKSPTTPNQTEDVELADSIGKSEVEVTKKHEKTIDKSSNNQFHLPLHHSLSMPAEKIKSKFSEQLALKRKTQLRKCNSLDMINRSKNKSTENIKKLVLPKNRSFDKTSESSFDSDDPEINFLACGEKLRTIKTPVHKSMSSSSDTSGSIWDEEPEGFDPKVRRETIKTDNDYKTLLLKIDKLYPSEDDAGLISPALVVARHIARTTDELSAGVVSAVTSPTSSPRTRSTDKIISFADVVSVKAVDNGALSDAASSAAVSSATVSSAAEVSMVTGVSSALTSETNETLPAVVANIDTISVAANKISDTQIENVNNTETETLCNSITTDQIQTANTSGDIPNTDDNNNDDIHAQNKRISQDQKHNEIMIYIDKKHNITIDNSKNIKNSDPVHSEQHLSPQYYTPQNGTKFHSQKRTKHHPPHNSLHHPPHHAPHHPPPIQHANTISVTTPDNLSVAPFGVEPAIQSAPTSPVEAAKLRRRFFSSTSKTMTSFDECDGILDTCSTRPVPDNVFGDRISQKIRTNDNRVQTSEKCEQVEENPDDNLNENHAEFTDDFGVHDFNENAEYDDTTSIDDNHIHNDANPCGRRFRSIVKIQIDGENVDEIAKGLTDKVIQNAESDLNDNFDVNCLTEDILRDLEEVNEIDFVGDNNISTYNDLGHESESVENLSTSMYQTEVGKTFLGEMVLSETLGYENVNHNKVKFSPKNFNDFNDYHENLFQVCSLDDHIAIVPSSRLEQLLRSFSIIPCKTGKLCLNTEQSYWWSPVVTMADKCVGTDDDDDEIGSIVESRSNMDGGGDNSGNNQGNNGHDEFQSSDDNQNFSSQTAESYMTKSNQKSSDDKNDYDQHFCSLNDESYMTNSNPKSNEDNSDYNQKCCSQNDESYMTNSNKKSSDVTNKTFRTSVSLLCNTGRKNIVYSDLCDRNENCITLTESSSKRESVTNLHVTSETKEYPPIDLIDSDTFQQTIIDCGNLENLPDIGLDNSEQFDKTLPLVDLVNFIDKSEIFETLPEIDFDSKFSNSINIVTLDNTEDVLDTNDHVEHNVDGNVLISSPITIEEESEQNLRTVTSTTKFCDETNNCQYTNTNNNMKTHNNDKTPNSNKLNFKSYYVTPNEKSRNQKVNYKNDSKRCQKCLSAFRVTNCESLYNELQHQIVGSFDWSTADMSSILPNQNHEAVNKKQKLSRLYRKFLRREDRAMNKAIDKYKHDVLLLQREFTDHYARVSHLLTSDEHAEMRRMQALRNDVIQEIRAMEDMLNRRVKVGQGQGLTYSSLTGIKVIQQMIELLKEQLSQRSYLLRVQDTFEQIDCGHNPATLTPGYLSRISQYKKNDLEKTFGEMRSGLMDEVKCTLRHHTQSLENQLRVRDRQVDFLYQELQRHHCQNKEKKPRKRPTKRVCHSGCHRNTETDTSGFHSNSPVSKKLSDRCHVCRHDNHSVIDSEDEYVEISMTDVNKWGKSPKLEKVLTKNVRKLNTGTQFNLRMAQT